MDKIWIASCRPAPLGSGKDALFALHTLQKVGHQILVEDCVKLNLLLFYTK